MAPLHLTHLPMISYLLPCLAVVFVAYKAYYAVQGPLSRLPGPQTSKWSRLPLKWAILKGDRTRFVHNLHNVYGPIVRISPDEVSLADLASAKTIYKVGSHYYKTDFYDSFTGNLKYRSLFTMVDPKQHGYHRRLTAFNFSEKWIANLEPYIAKNVRLAIDRMSDEEATKGYFDAFKWFTFMATDVIGEASFGESFRMLDTGKKNQYIEDLEKTGSRNIYRVEFPWLAKLMYYLPWGPGRELNRAVDRMSRYANESVERYWRQFRAEGEDNVKPTILTKEYAAVENGTISNDQVVRDGMGNIIAGTDTTAITATYAVWLLSSQAELQQELIREVSTLPTGFKDDDLRSLQLLGGVINETLRLRAPVGQGLPRRAPPGTHLSGYFIPEGYTVGIQAYTIHRNPSIWKNPESFDPYRWYEPSNEMLQAFLPFGGGSHVCIGRHTAELELRHALANFYRTFESGVKAADVDGFGEDDMAPVSYFLSPPKGLRCFLKRRK